MLVYGDVEEIRQARDLQVEVAALLRRCYAHKVHVERHGDLVNAFLAGAELVGGLVDRQAAAAGCDSLTPVAEIGTRALLMLAHAVDISWRSGLLDATTIEAAGELIAALPADGALSLKPMEGYTHYAVYPESYAMAARRSRLPPQTRVIGIRGIGLSLGAMVAAALKSPDLVSVRPVGHPFDRRIALSPRLAARLLEGSPSYYAIVDEGPGLSGSSFSSVADWLVAHGVPRTRLRLFPSHLSDPGSEAGEERVRNWRAMTKHHVPMDQMLLGGPLERWVGALAGPLTHPLADISWGHWRDRVAAAGPAPLAPGQERRKFLARSNSDQWLVKYAGLRRWGERKLAIATHLQQAGHCPEVIGACHGFLVQRWVEAPSLPAATVSRHQLVEEFASYLARRSEMRSPFVGATPERLKHMAEHNTAEALGPSAGAAISARLADVPAAEAAIRPVLVDARMHQWEWLVRAGRLIKTDAVDHALSHDLVGPQDIAWDVAGAVVEHELSERETAGLIAALELHSGRPFSRALLAFLLPCYLAFQLGLWTMGAGADAAVARRYAAALSRLAAASRDQSVISALTNPSGRSRVASSAVPRSSSA